MKMYLRSILLLLISISISFAQERINFEKGSLKVKYLGNSNISAKIDSNAMISEFLVQFHDGSQYNNDYRSTYQYNTIGKVDEIMDQVWDGSDWQNDFRIQFDYNESGFNTMTTYQSYSGTAWENSSRSIVVNDSNGNPIHIEDQTWYQNAWAPYVAEDNVFGPDSQLVESISSQYDYWNPSPKWSYLHKSTFTYNQQGQRTSRETRNFGPDSSWFLTFREDIRYNSDGLEQSKKSVISNDSGVTFDPFLWDTTAYNNNKKRTYHHRQYHNGSNWQDEYLSESTYLDTLEKERVVTMWARTSDQMSKEKYTFNYNQQNQLNDVIEQYWNNGAWENFWHDYYSYNQYGYHSEIETFMWYSSSWNPFSKYLMTYTMVVDVGDMGKLTKDFVLYQNYPNPFNSMTKIIYYLPIATNVTLKLFNAIGQEVKLIDSGFKLAGKHEMTLNEFNLSSGVYYYQLITKFGEATKKMILLK